MQITIDRGRTFNVDSIAINNNIISSNCIIGSLKVELDRYIINENATILFWDDNTKTISKRHKEDKFDKELGFLFAYFYKKYKGSKASMKRVLDTIDYKKIKTFLFEFYVNDIGEDNYDKARNYLKKLVVSK